IRVFHVTGVQTCALPISAAPAPAEAAGDVAMGAVGHRLDPRPGVALAVDLDRDPSFAARGFLRGAGVDAAAVAGHEGELVAGRRSEERRVGNVSGCG